jgi:AAA ATPase domain/Adenylate and Guanylate cyclase catalytic domain
LLARYFERIKRIVESHGGSVEKFIGDAVMAVFGVPVAHEDDALRACRAAVEMRAAFPELGISGRIGVNTGEVVTGTEERLATGDAVNVAARLEQAAQPGDVLIGEGTLGLVRAAVDVGERRVLHVKGKEEAVHAWPLLAVTGELVRRFATPMVGRETELRRLSDAFQQAAHDRSCQLFTVLGSAGVGKSRLAAEFLGDLDARVVRGRCLSYGEGITYWPVVEILKQLGAFPGGDAARPLRSLLGETEVSAGSDEIAWGFRKLLEQEAQERPLVCLLDDLHWAEETLLDLVEHTADLSRDAPLLLLCMARPELLERRPSWSGGKWNATTVLLEPLDAAETERLIAELGGVGKELHERILQVAEGNPLFLEEMLALVRDSGGAQVEVPPTIQALLAARLDQLDPAERPVLERGSVEGRTFHRGAVAALADGDGSADQRLIALVRKELVRPDRPQLPGDDAYRFRHLLIRDAAYDALPKATRADLHERFARWIEQHGTGLVELDEILGYHFEQACLYRVELGLEVDEELRSEARRHLTDAGRRAIARQDFLAASHLVPRALTSRRGKWTYRSRSTARTRSSPRATPRGRAAPYRRRPHALRPRTTGSASCAPCSRARCTSVTSRPAAACRSSKARSPRRCQSSRRPATITPSMSCISRAARPRTCAATSTRSSQRWSRRCSTRSAPDSRMSLPGPRLRAAPLAISDRIPSPTCSPGSTDRSRSARTGGSPTGGPPRSPCSVASKKLAESGRTTTKRSRSAATF